MPPTDHHLGCSSNGSCLGCSLRASSSLNWVRVWSIMVLHEEPSNSNSGGGSRSSSKKSKQKKPRQRGMGVAQLEELRMREQQQQQQHKTVVPSSSGLASAQQPSLPFLASPDFLGQSSKPAGCSGSAESGILPVLEPCGSRRYSLHSSLQSSSSLQRWPHQQQQQFEMMYRTSSSSSSSGVTTLMEPPSNQSYCSNQYPLPPDCPEEERAMSMKRPWPFLPDCSTSHISLPCKMPAFSHAFLKPEDGNGSNKYVPKGAAFRGSNWCSSTNQIDCKRYYIPHDNHGSKENPVVARDGNYLSLGTLEAPSFSRIKQKFSTSGPPECPKFNSLPCQRSICEAKSHPPQFYNFLPMTQKSQENTTKDRRAESPDAIDLNLKL